MEGWSSQNSIRAGETESALDALRRRLLVVFPFQVVLAGVVVVVLFGLMRRGMNDPDIWWHMRNAQYLMQNHQLPRHDSYSFTVAGHPWINHEWLSEIPYYLAWQAGGLSGVNAVMFATICSIFLGLLYLSYMETSHFKAAI